MAAHRLREEERIAAEIEEASNDIDLQDFDEPEANIECSGIVALKFTKLDF